VVAELLAIRSVSGQIATFLTHRATARMNKSVDKRKNGVINHDMLSPFPMG